MATDIITLGIEIDASSLNQAVHKLDSLAQSSRKATDQLHSGARRATDDLDSVRGATDRLARENSTACNSIDRLEKSFKSLVKTLGGAAAAYISLDKAMGFLKRGLDFNSSLETAEIGMSSLITSMVKLQDVAGRPLEGMEKYQAAKGMAKELVQQIQLLGLQTTATSQELVEGVQSIMGPALQAGMALKDIPKFAVQGAQAMQTLGVPLNQMRTELEALLSGNINKAQDILAPKLFADVKGDLKEYINGLRESGTLIDEIMRRLEPFKLAGEDVAQTWSGLASNFEEALDKLAGDAAKGFTSSMKEVVGVMSDLVLDTKTGTISKDFEGIARVLTEIENIIGQNILAATKAVAETVRDLGQWVNEIGVDEVLDRMEKTAIAAAAGFTTLIAVKKGYITTAGQLTKSLFTVEQSIAANTRAAKEELIFARQQLASYRQQVAGRVQLVAAAQGEAAAAKVRQASFIRETALIDNATAALGRYTAALGSSALSAARNSYTTSTTALGNGLKSLVAFMGGPLGAVLTVATVGITALALQTDKCTEASEAYSKAQESWETMMRKCTDETGNFRKELTATQQKMMEIAKQKNEEAFSKILSQIQAIANGMALTKEQIGFSEWGFGGFNVNDIIPQSYIDHFNGLINMLREEGPSATQRFSDCLADLSTSLKDAGYGNTEFAKSISEMYSQADSLIPKLLDTSTHLNTLAGSANAASASVSSLKAAMAGSWSIDTKAANSYLESVEKQIRDLQIQRSGLHDVKGFAQLLPDVPIEKATEALEAYQKSGVDGFISKLGESYHKLNAEQQISIVASADAAARYREEKKATDEVLESRRKSSSRSSGGSSSTKSAIADQKDYTLQILKSQEQAAKLEEQLKKTGTTEQSLALARERINREYESELEKNAKERLAMQGKVSAAELKSYEISQNKVAELNKELKLQEAQKSATQKNVQVAQGQLKFYKELGQLSGNYGNTLDLQNQLLEQQAQKYRDELEISEDLVNQWLYFQKLAVSQDPMDGAYRGVLKFTSEYADSAKQWEDISYNFAKDFTSQTRSMFDDFLDNGKISFDGFQSLFKQLLKDLAWQAIAQPIVLSVVAGMTGAIGGGSSAYAATGATGGVAASGASGGMDLTGLANQGASYASKYAMSQLGGNGGIMGSITSSINSYVADMFPSMFASSSQVATINGAINTQANLLSQAGLQSAATSSLPTQTFTAGLGTAGIGAGIGALASPYLNSLLGLQNNEGSSIGSMIGGGLGTLIGAMVPGAGWIAGGIAALGSLLGGGVGSLFGGAQQHAPELYSGYTNKLWERFDEDDYNERYPGGASSSFNSDSISAWSSGDHGSDYGTSQGMASALGEVMRNGQIASNAIEDSLRAVDESLSSQYVQALKERGEIGSFLFLEGKDINQGNMQTFVQSAMDDVQNTIIDALTKLDLTPLTRAADGMVADTTAEIGESFTKIFEYVNSAATIEDEELREKFSKAAISQMAGAVENISFAPLTKAADGFAVKTMDELSESLESVFNLYDLSENLSDEEAKATFQAWAQNAIEKAFKDLDMSYLRVDFDQTSFAGLQQAYAAIQAWNTVTDSIENIINPVNEFDSAMNAAASQFDQWITNLRELGWQEEAIAEIEAKRASYMATYQQQLERETQQSLTLRYASLKYGSDSFAYGVQNLRFQQANELESVKQKFGENSGYYAATKKAQEAESTKYVLDYLKQQKSLLEQQETERQKASIQAQQEDIQARQKEIQARQQALNEELSAKQKEINAANQLADKFRRLAQEIAEFRRDLWTGEQNLTGSRYDDAYSQFNTLYEKAMQGDENAYNEITGKASELLTLGRETLPERGEYNDLFYDVDQKLKAVQSRAEQQVSEAEKQARLLEGQLETLERQQEQLEAELELLNLQNEELLAQSEALNTQIEQGTECNLTLAQINEGIAALEAAMQYQTASMAQAYQQTAAYDWEGLYSEKVAALNKESYMGKSDWDRESLLKAIKDGGMTPQQWYDLYGKQEGFILRQVNSMTYSFGNDMGHLGELLNYGLDTNSKYLNNTLTSQLDHAILTGTDINGILASELENWPAALGKMDSMTSSIVGAIGGLQSSIASAISQAEKAYAAAAASYDSSSSGGGSSKSSSSSSKSSSSSSSSKSGIYGSKYSSETALLTAKANAMNQGKTNAPNQATSGWTASKVASTIKSAGLTTSQWYKQYGKLEGFASGGITPPDRMFLVGEEGPELMMSPQRYGVINHEATKAIMERDGAANIRNEENREDMAALHRIGEGIAELSVYLRQLIVKADDTAYSNEKIRNILASMSMDTAALAEGR